MKPIFLILLTLAFSCPIRGADRSVAPQAAISFIGFFNWETREFSPEIISYKLMINFHKAHEALEKELAEKGYQVLEEGIFEQTFNEFTNREIALLRQIITSLQTTAHTYLNTGTVVATNKQELSFPDISSRNISTHWNDNSRIYLFLGLEALSPSGAGLRSGLAGVAFRGDGKFLGMTVVEYNFTNYHIDQFVEDCSRIIEAIDQ